VAHGRPTRCPVSDLDVDASGHARQVARPRLRPAPGVVRTPCLMPTTAIPWSAASKTHHHRALVAAAGLRQHQVAIPACSQTRKQALRSPRCRGHTVRSRSESRVPGADTAPERTHLNLLASRRRFRLPPVCRPSAVASMMPTGTIEGAREHWPCRRRAMPFGRRIPIYPHPRDRDVRSDQ